MKKEKEEENEEEEEEGGEGGGGGRGGGRRREERTKSGNQTWRSRADCVGNDLGSTGKCIAYFQDEQKLRLDFVEMNEATHECRLI